MLLKKYLFLVVLISINICPISTDKIVYGGLYSISALAGWLATYFSMPDAKNSNEDESQAEIALRKGFAGSLGLGAAWYTFKLGEQVLSRHVRPGDWLLPDKTYDVIEHDVEFGSYKFNHPEKLGHNFLLVYGKRFLEEGTTPIVVCSKLFLPVVEPGKKVPIIMLVHHSKGITDDVLQHARWLTQQGVAVFVIDHFGNRWGKGRGLIRTGNDQFKLATEEQLIDIFIARKLLAEKYLELDMDSVGIAGMSRGGEIAMMAQHRHIYENLDANQKPFDIAYSYYLPTISQPFDIEDGVAKKPFAAFVGMADRYAPPEKTIGYLGRLKAHDYADAELHTYTNGFHGFDHQEYFSEKVPWYCDPLMPLINMAYKHIAGFRTYLNEVVDIEAHLPGSAYYLCDAEGFLPCDANGINYFESNKKYPYQDSESGIDLLEGYMRSRAFTSSIYSAYDLGVHLQVLKDTKNFLQKHNFLP